MKIFERRLKNIGKERRVYVYKIACSFSIKILKFIPGI